MSAIIVNRKWKATWKVDYVGIYGGCRWERSTTYQQVRSLFLARLECVVIPVPTPENDTYACGRRYKVASLQS